MTDVHKHSNITNSKSDQEFNRLVQTVLDQTGVKTTPEVLPNYVQFDPNDSAPDYIGINEDSDASDSDTDWVIFKFTYSGDNATKIRRKTGAWSGRVALFA